MAGTTRSSIGGGGTRVTDHYDDGSSTDRDYVKGDCVAITDHDRDGSSHTHEVKHGFLGTYKGDIIKK